MITQDQAVDKLMESSWDSLFLLCKKAHDYQYGFGEPTSHFYNYDIPRLVNWYIEHYTWDMKEQRWRSKFKET